MSKWWDRAPALKSGLSSTGMRSFSALELALPASEGCSSLLQPAVTVLGFMLYFVSVSVKAEGRRYSIPAGCVCQRMSLLRH